MVQSGQNRVFSRLGCQLRVATIPARAAFAAPGPLGARHATYKVRICRNGTAGRFWCIWGGERAGKSDIRGRVISEDVFSPALELSVLQRWFQRGCGALT